MPSMANITAKNAADADVVFNAMSPSSGNGTAAIWRPESIGDASAFRPVFEVRTSDNGPKTARSLTANIKFPYTITVDGAPVVVHTVPFSLTGTLPKAVPDTFYDDVAAYLASLLSSSLFKEVVTSGYAPS